jgi:hypothetical protein
MNASTTITMFTVPGFGGRGEALRSSRYLHCVAVHNWDGWDGRVCFDHIIPRLSYSQKSLVLPLCTVHFNPSLPLFVFVLAGLDGTETRPPF